LTEAELNALPITLTHFKPGQIIFNRGDYFDSLSYLYNGDVFLESSSDHGQLVESGIFKASYPLSPHNIHPFTAIAKTQTSIACMPLSLLETGSQATLAYYLGQTPGRDCSVFQRQLSSSLFLCK